MRLVGHWKAESDSFVWGDGAKLLDEGGVLTLSYPEDSVLMPRVAVARSPSFSSLRRSANASLPPRRSIYIEREDLTAAMPIPGVPEAEKPFDVLGDESLPWGQYPEPLPNLRSPRAGCLGTREPGLRTTPTERWTIEVVALFLGNAHFGRAFQTIVGRDGVNMTRNASSFEARLASLYIKLTPEKRLRLEAWAAADTTQPPQWLSDEGPIRARHSVHRALSGERVAFVELAGRSTLEPDTWYSIVATSDGQWMRLFVNGKLEGMERAYGGLAIPPRRQDGGLTLGCGMFDGVPADTCSCLINEARVSDDARPMREWLWSPGPPPPPVVISNPHHIL